MQLPPPQVTRAVIRRYAQLLSRYRSEFGVRPLVVPDASFFPDVFRPDAASLERIARRMQIHAGMCDIPILPVIGSEQPADSAPSSCGNGACAVPASVTSGAPRLLDDGDGWRILVPEAELRHPVALTTNLARSLAFIFLIETQREGEALEPPLDVTADLVATALGFGPLLLQGAHIYAKGCGGPQITSVTKVPLPELSVAVALFAALGGHPLAPALKALDATQRSLLAEARDLLHGNQELIELIELHPDLVACGEFDLDAPGSFLTNWLRKGRRRRQASELSTVAAAVQLQTEHPEAHEVEALMIAMPPSSRAGRANSATS